MGTLIGFFPTNLFGKLQRDWIEIQIEVNENESWIIRREVFKSVTTWNFQETIKDRFQIYIIFPTPNAKQINLHRFLIP